MVSGLVVPEGASRVARQVVQVLGAMAIGEEAIMPDRMKPLGSKMEQEPRDGSPREGASPSLCSHGHSLGAEADLPVFASQEALVADGDPMGVVPRKAEHRFGTAEGGLGVDDPSPWPGA